MANVPFSTSKYGKTLLGATGTHKPSIGFMGESHGERLPSAVAYSLARYYHADVVMDYRAYADGGQNFAVGGTNTVGTNGLTTQIGWFQTRPTDIVFIASGYNDAPASAADALTVCNTVISVAESCRDAGAMLVVIVGQTPRGGPHDASLNTILKAYCARTDGMAFLDITPIISDFNVINHDYRDIVSNPAGTYQSYTVDGTHWSGKSNRLIAPLISDILKRVCPERKPLMPMLQGNYDPVTNPYANMLGDAGSVQGTAGILQSSFNTGVAGVDASSRLKIVTNGTGVSVAPSIITGDSGEFKQRMTLNGSGSGYVYLQCQPTISNPNNGDNTRYLTFECLVDLTNITGIRNIYLRPMSATYDSCVQIWGGTNTESDRYDDGTTESLFLYTTMPIPVPSTANPTFQIFFMTNAGPASHAGTIDVSHMSVTLT